MLEDNVWRLRNMFMFYYKKGSNKMEFKIDNNNKESVKAGLSQIARFLNEQIYDFLDPKSIQQINKLIDNIKQIEDINKIKPKDISKDLPEHKTWYENYFIVKAIEKFGYLPFPNFKEQLSGNAGFNDERIVLVCNTDFWTIIKKHKFKDETKEIPMFAISSILYSVNERLLELIEENNTVPIIQTRKSFKEVIENVREAPKDDLKKNIHVNAVLKNGYEPYITPQLIYKAVPKKIQAMLKLPKKKKKKK